MKAKAYTWFLAEIQSGEMTICEPETFDDLRGFPISQLPKLKLSNDMIKFFETMPSNEVRINS